MSKNSFTGIILSGGKSSRMGTEKGLISVNGKHMIEHSISILKTMCSEILISTNHSGYNFLGYKTIPDLIPECGPMGGIYSGLSASQNEYCLVAPCDVPFLTIEIYTILLEHISSNNIIIPAINNEIQILCGIYSKKCIPDLEIQLRQNKFKLLKYIEEFGAKIISINPNLKSTGIDIFTNINTPAELNRVSEFLKK